jgi:hypothetical protein
MIQVKKVLDNIPVAHAATAPPSRPWNGFESDAHRAKVLSAFFAPKPVG